MQVAAEQTTELMPLLRHGAAHLPSLRLESYNLELKDASGFVGDRASKSSFAELLDKWRQPLGRRGDPFGRGASAEISRKKLDALLADGPPGAAAPLVASIEAFAQQLASVIHRRVLLLAHYPSDVIGGLALGAAIDAPVARSIPAKGRPSPAVVI